MAPAHRRLAAGRALLLVALCAIALPARAAPACKMDHAPVCGKNGITYANRCIAEIQGVQVAKQGPCVAAGPAVAAASAAAGAPPPTAAFLTPKQLDTAAVVGMPVMAKYASEGYSFVGRVKLSKRRVTPITKVQAAGPQAAAVAGVAGMSAFAVRITPAGDLYVGRLKNLPAGLLSTAPARPAGPQAAAASAATGEPQPVNATQQHRKLLAGNIVGTDNRIEIDKHTYPYTAVGFVGSGCSGSMIGPRTVLTAGHCLWDTYSQSWMGGYNFYPNRHSGGYHCHGSGATRKCYYPREVAWEWASTPFVNAQNCGPGCITSSDIPLDVAVIRLKEVTTSFTGYFGLQRSCGAKRYSCRTAGYPSDRRPADYGTRMFTTTGTVPFSGCAGWTSGSVAKTTIDAYPGQSGSAAWTTDLNVRGVLSCTGGGYTYFRGLTDGAISWIMKNRV